ncbi:HV146 protein, partial [Atractosteus spatula]|nr:HV146 protein [Atractosteus spatula]MBN3322270.1 HV146 protein [Atractosteus spatula]
MQSGPQVKKAGESLILSCQGSGQDVYRYGFSNSYTNWIQQTPGKGLEWLAYISRDGGNTSYAQSVKGRLTISQNISSSTLYLQMSSLKIEDSAVYYCATHMQIKFSKQMVQKPHAVCNLGKFVNCFCCGLLCSESLCYHLQRNNF